MLLSNGCHIVKKEIRNILINKQLRIFLVLKAGIAYGESLHVIVKEKAQPQSGLIFVFLFLDKASLHQNGKQKSQVF